MFGQLLSTHSIPALLKVLEDSNESDMVRHEAAEALGGIATPEVLPHLKTWMSRPDAPQVVRESCQVAIDMWEVRAVFCSVSLSGACVHDFGTVRKFGRVPIRQHSAEVGTGTASHCCVITNPSKHEENGYDKVLLECMY